MGKPSDLGRTTNSEFPLAHEEADRIWEEFFPRLIQFARSRMDGMRDGTFDEEDIALSALKSFFRARKAGRVLPDQENDDLWRLLVTICARKLTAQRRRAHAVKRGGHLQTLQDSDMQNTLAQLMDKNRIPESTTAIFAACEELLARLKDDKLCKTAIMRMEGYSNREIADRLECSVARTKQRIARIKQIWSALYD